MTALQIAERFVGIKEVKGAVDNPLILAMLGLDAKWPDHDEVPWCSAFVNFVAWLLGLSRSKNLMARSWLTVGDFVLPFEVKAGFDIVIFERPPNPKSGHVAFFIDKFGDVVKVLGGNQSDSVSTALYPIERVIAYRRLVKVSND